MSIEREVIEQEVIGQEVVIKRPGQTVPRLTGDGQRFVLAGNGLFLERRTGFFSTTRFQNVTGSE